MYKNSSYLAIDPGHTSGWATFNDEGDMLEFGQFKMEKIMDELPELLHENLIMVVVEDYRNHGWMQQKKWSRNETSKIIGKIEMLAGMRNVPITLQSNTVKGIGQMWAGIDPPKNHAISHKFDAVGHGVYYLQSNGIRPVGRAQKGD